MADGATTKEDDEVSEDPPYETCSDNSNICCDVCIRKGLEDVVAIGYCTNTICKKRYCAEHQKHHDDLLDGHCMIDISGYSEPSSKSAEKFCAMHPTERLTMGCRSCLSHLCMKCVNDLTACGGSTHSLASLNSVFEDVKELVEELRMNVEEKRNSYLALSEESEKVIKEYDADTEIMIAKIEEKRDAQIKAISEKYSRLASELMTVRQGPYSKVVEFKKTAVDSPLEDLTVNLQTVISTLESGSEIDTVDAYHKTKNKLKCDIDQRLPSLTVSELFVELTEEEECRNPELALRSTNDTLTIGISTGLKATVYENFVPPTTATEAQNFSDIGHYEVPRPNLNIIQPAERSPTKSSKEMPVNAEAPYVNVHNEVPHLKPPLKEPEELCAICKHELTNPLRLSCSHTFCKACLNELIHAPMPNLCPECSQSFVGNQPNGGKMATTSNLKFTGRGIQRWMQITYSIPFGLQQPNHPNPGHPYKGTEKTVNIPQTSTGLWIASQLVTAFNKKILFTISNEEEAVYNIDHPKSKYPSSSELGQLKDLLQLHLGINS